MSMSERDGTICHSAGARLQHPVTEKRMARNEMQCADAAFFTGTAAEVARIGELDHRTIGAGSRGPITGKLESAFFATVQGKNAKYSEWLAHI